MTGEKSSYRQIMKATSLFGGVQVFQILISVVRSKFVALLLGPSGMGIVALLTATTGLVNVLTNFGLGTSAVKNISETLGGDDRMRTLTVVAVLRRLVWATGLLGALLTLVFAPWLSEFTFGNREYTLAFVWLSISLLLGQLTTGELVILQAFRRLQFLAKANVYGSFVGLVFAIPIYYVFNIEGIVPVIIVTALASYIFSRFFTRKIKMEKVKVTRAALTTEGKSMMVMGLAISLSALSVTATAYILRVFVNQTGSMEDVGFYNAGFAIINTYVGMVFTAMGTDYYPRLSAVASDNRLCKENTNQQSEIALLILAPILLFFLVFVNWAVILLYSSQFLVISGMVHWAALGIFFKAVSWPISFIFLAKGEGKLYFWSECAFSIYALLFSVVGYKWYGLTGLGISFLAAYMLYFIQVFILAKVKYQFSLYSSLIAIFLVQFLLAMLCLAVVTLVGQPYAYLAGIPLIAISIGYSYKKLEKRVGIKEFIKSKFQKTKKNDS